MDIVDSLFEATSVELPKHVAIVNLPVHVYVISPCANWVVTAKELGIGHRIR